MELLLLPPPLLLFHARLLLLLLRPVGWSMGRAAVSCTSNARVATATVRISADMPLVDFNRIVVIDVLLFLLSLYVYSYSVSLIFLCLFCWLDGELVYGSTFNRSAIERGV